jgi:PhzF family phenazine biosynthesis protein
MISGKKIYQVDAFTDEPFKGNPAGVMIIDKPVDAKWMQNIALEMNLSETAFVLPGEQNFEIRYFTPTREVPLCGHATLASAHILYELGLVKPTASICFKAKAADLTIKKEAEWILMNFPRYSLNKIDVPKNFKNTVGFEPIEAYSSNDQWVIAVAKKEEEILNAAPKFESMIAKGLGHLMITAESKAPGVDFVVRCFAPTSGINEDPVTGSAHCALTPLWFNKTGKTEMHSLQVSKRTGKLSVKLIDDRVEIKGKAITVFEAVLKI